MQKEIVAVYSSYLLNNRYNCRIRITANNTYVLTNAVLDTGAMLTCIDFLTSMKLCNLKRTGNCIKISGIDSASILEYDEVYIDYLTLGDITLNTNKIFLAKNPSVKKTLLGMDLLKDLDIRQLGYTGVLLMRAGSLSNSSTFRVTNQNVDQLLKRVLSDNALTEQENRIRKLLPNVIDMSYLDFSKLLERLIKSST